MLYEVITYLFVRKYPADLTVRIEQVAKDPGSGWAGLDAGGQPSLAGSLDAEGALFHFSFGPDTVAEVVLAGVDLVFRYLGRPVITSYSIHYTKLYENSRIVHLSVDEVPELRFGT